MKKVTVEDIGGEILKDTSEYLLKDLPFGEHLTLSSTQLRANQSTTGHSHDNQEEVYYFHKGIGEMHPPHFQNDAVPLLPCYIFV